MLNQTCSVKEVLSVRRYNINLRRYIGEELREEWDNLIEILDGFVLTNEKDVLKWRGRNGQYSTSEGYKWLKEGVKASQNNK